MNFFGGFENPMFSAENSYEAQEFNRLSKMKQSIFLDSKKAYFLAFKKKKRNKAIENRIKRTSLWSALYARNYLKKRWPEAEKVILSRPLIAIEYAKHFFKKERWKEGEKVFSKDVFCAVTYAHRVIKGRWKRAERTIKKYPNFAAFYSLNVMKKAWAEGEEAIKHSMFREFYGNKYGWTNTSRIRDPILS